MKKTGFICLMLIMALAFMGMGYAEWSKSVSMNTHVETGNLIMGIRNLGVMNCRPGQEMPPPDPKGKNVGFVVLTDGPYRFELGGLSYSDSVAIRLKGYPGYSPFCTVQLANGGTIPARIGDFTIKWHGGMADNIFVTNWAVTFPEGFQASGTGFHSLRKVIRNASVDPGHKMLVEIQFLCAFGGAAGGEISIDYCPWNDKSPKSKW